MNNFNRTLPNHRKVAWRFHSRKHTLAEHWSKILNKKTWHAPTPESSLSSIAAWAWAKHWDKMGGKRPAIGYGMFSLLVSEGTAFVNSDGLVFYSLGNARWGAQGLQMTIVADPGETNATWNIWTLKDAEPKWMFCFNPESWMHLTYEVCCPNELHEHNPRNMPHNILFHELRREPLLEYAFTKEEKLNMTLEDLCYLAKFLGVLDNIADKRKVESVLTALGKEIFKHKAPEEQDMLIDALVKREQRAPKKLNNNNNVDPITEAIVGHLDPEYKKDHHTRIQSDVEKLNHKRKLLFFRTTEKQKKRKRQQNFLAATKAKAPARREQTPAPDILPAIDPRAHEASVDRPNGPQSHPRNPNLFWWSSPNKTLQFKFRRTKPNCGRPYGGWIAICCLCPSDVAANSRTQIPTVCSRTLVVQDASEEANELCKRQLKHWLLQGNGNRFVHMSGKEHSYYPDDSTIGSNATLEQRLASLEAAQPAIFSV